MEMILPVTYSAINEKEMMYIEGDWEYTGIYNDVAAFGINVIVNGIMGGGTVKTVLRILGGNRSKKEVAEYIARYLGVRAANTLAGTILGAIAGFSSWGFGFACAKLWDQYDRAPNNGICGRPTWL